MTDANYYCLCCESAVLTEPPGGAVICPVCYWRDDGDGASLEEAQRECTPRPRSHELRQQRPDLVARCRDRWHRRAGTTRQPRGQRRM